MSTDLEPAGTVIVDREQRAHELESEVFEGCQAIRKAWVYLAAYLYEMQSGHYYQLLGYESFDEWIGIPEISLSRSHVYALTGAYSELVIERKIELSQIEDIDSTKLGEILPAIRSGRVEVLDAIADAKVLSRSDLREKLTQETGHPLDAEKARPICPHCGNRMKAGKS